MSRLDDLAAKFLRKAMQPPGTPDAEEAWAATQTRIQGVAERMERDPRTGEQWFTLLFHMPDDDPRRADILARLMDGTLEESSVEALANLNTAWARAFGGLTLHEHLAAFIASRRTLDTQPQS